MSPKISWLGHSSVKIKGSIIIYLDPWKIKAEEKAELILISHGHSDHFSLSDIKKIQKKETVILGPLDCISQLAGDTRTMEPGDVIAVSGASVAAVPAYNIGKSFHPRNIHNR